MRLMIIGNLEGQLGTASDIAARRGAQVTHYLTPDEAIMALSEGKGADIVMITVQENIATFIHAIRAQHISVPVIACGIARDKEAAVRAIKAGAKEYIPLPPDEELIAAVLQAITQESHQLLYRSAEMQRVVNLADQIAPSDATVLITGESGTGKEVIARYIHQHSARKDKPFISVNCAAIPENLLESELFGHEKGAFTGALGRRIGKFEEADKGTLLLDEISEMDLRLQAKLLRALQEREIDRVGGTKPVKVDIRIIATSNRDMMKIIRSGAFREDLYYRLNVINIALPSLRERTEDITLLAEHFIQKYSKANNVAVRPLSEGAKEKLLSYSYAGNVRELENMMHRAVLMARGNQIDEEAIVLPSYHIAALQAGIQHTDNHPHSHSQEEDEVALLVGRTVADVEKELILKTLDHCLGNRTHAANILGISIRTLRNKLRLYDDPRYE
jgi:DNA-binding NtrC family response regulator